MVHPPRGQCYGPTYDPNRPLWKSTLKSSSVGLALDESSGPDLPSRKIFVATDFFLC